MRAIKEMRPRGKDLHSVYWGCAILKHLLRSATDKRADSLYSRSFRLLHLLDTMVVVDPYTFPERLRRAGFADVQVDVMKPHAFRFRARKATVTFPARDEVLGA
jgi:hypothetical protein